MFQEIISCFVTTSSVEVFRYDYEAFKSLHDQNAAISPITEPDQQV